MTQPPTTPTPAFTIGQRIRTTINLPAGWPGGFSAPTGTLGTIARRLDRDARADGHFDGRYGVFLDGDPVPGRKVVYDTHQLAPA